MTTRKLLYVLTLMAYMLSLAHSVIPHHHHNSPEEATAHHYTNDHHNSDRKGIDHQHESHDGDAGHFFFFSHDINADALAHHSPIDNPVNAKKIYHVSYLHEQVITLEITESITMHPPQDDMTFYNAFQEHHTLRGPPSVNV